MSKLVVCRLCSGQKKINGMGFMSMPCPECDAKGYVKNDFYVCSVCNKQITLDAAKTVITDVKKTRARKVSRDVISVDDMSLVAHDDTASY